MPGPAEIGLAIENCDLVVSEPLELDGCANAAETRTYYDDVEIIHDVCRPFLSWKLGNWCPADAPTANLISWNFSGKSALSPRGIGTDWFELCHISIKE